MRKLTAAFLLLTAFHSAAAADRPRLMLPEPEPSHGHASSARAGTREFAALMAGGLSTRRDQFVRMEPAAVASIDTKSKVNRVILRAGFYDLSLHDRLDFIDYLKMKLYQGRFDNKPQIVFFVQREDPADGKPRRIGVILPGEAFRAEVKEMKPDLGKGPLADLKSLPGPRK